MNKTSKRNLLVYREPSSNIKYCHLSLSLSVNGKYVENYHKSDVLDFLPHLFDMILPQSIFLVSIENS